MMLRPVGVGIALVLASSAATTFAGTPPERPSMRPAGTSIDATRGSDGWADAAGRIEPGTLHNPTISSRPNVAGATDPHRVLQR